MRAGVDGHHIQLDVGQALAPGGAAGADRSPVVRLWYSFRIKYILGLLVLSRPW